MDEDEYFRRKGHAERLSIKDLVTEPDDSLLTAVIFCHIADYTGNCPLHLRRLNGPQSVVALAYGVGGIIANGGLEGLFSAKIADDPDFALTVGAFRAISADSQASALSQALSIFEGQTSPLDPELQYLHWMAVDALRRERWQEMFFSSFDELDAKIARYVRRNAAAFENLKRA